MRARAKPELLGVLMDHAFRGQIPPRRWWHRLPFVREPRAYTHTWAEPLTVRLPSRYRSVRHSTIRDGWEILDVLTGRRSGIYASERSADSIADRLNGKELST